MSKENGTKGYLVGYCRVSTADQNAELQLDALTAAGCDRIFTDNASGKLEHRPALDTMMEVLRPGDVVLIWRLDRLGRSVKHLLEMVAQLESRGVGLRSLCESIDTTTPTGRLTLHLFASIGQFERDLLLERTHAGLAAARARVAGRRYGLRRSSRLRMTCTTTVSTMLLVSPGSWDSAGPACTGRLPIEASRTTAPLGTPRTARWSLTFEHALPPLLRERERRRGRCVPYWYPASPRRLGSAWLATF